MSPRTAIICDIGHGVDALAPDSDGTGIRFQQPEDHLEDDRLAGPARAEQHGHVPGLHREADFAKDHVVVEGKRHLVELDDRHIGADMLMMVRQRRRGVRHRDVIDPSLVHRYATRGPRARWALPVDTSGTSLPNSSANACKSAQSVTRSPDSCRYLPLPFGRFASSSIV